MWPLADRACQWMCLDVDDNGVTVTRGTAGDPRPIDRGKIENAVWLPIWDRYRAACDEAADLPFATFRGATAEKVTTAHRELRAACTAMYEVIAKAASSELGPERIVVARTDRLATFTLARVVAAARPDLCAARRLPWDLPIGTTFADLPRLAGVVPQWCLPAPGRLTILAPMEMELERVIDAAGDNTALAHAWLARWLVELESALSFARAAGAEVIRPVTSCDLLAALDGHHRECLQLIAHADDYRDTLFLDSERISLRALAAAISDRVARGWRSPVRTADLATCNSAGRLGRALRSAGIEYVSGRVGNLHFGAVAHWVRVLYERHLFDGATPIAHAWLLAAHHEDS